MTLGGQGALCPGSGGSLGGGSGIADLVPTGSGMALHRSAAREGCGGNRSAHGRERNHPRGATETSRSTPKQKANVGWPFFSFAHPGEEFGTALAGWGCSVPGLRLKAPTGGFAPEMAIIIGFNGSWAWDWVGRSVRCCCDDN